MNPPTDIKYWAIKVRERDVAREVTVPSPDQIRCRYLLGIGGAEMDEEGPAMDRLRCPSDSSAELYIGTVPQIAVYCVLYGGEREWQGCIGRRERACALCSCELYFLCSGFVSGWVV